MRCAASRRFGDHLFSFAGICYLFLGGVGGGLALVAGLAALSIPREIVHAGVLPSCESLMAASFGSAAGLLFLAALLLLADAGNLDALGHLFLAPKISWMAVGAWALAATMALCFALALMWRCRRFPGGVALLRVLSALVSAAALVVVLYTGFLLSSMRAVALWNTLWLPALFVASSLSCGFVGLATLSYTCGASEEFRQFTNSLLRADLLAVVLEAVCAAAVVVAAFDPGLLGGLVPHFATATQEAGVASALALVTGRYARIWWVVFVLAGLVATAVLDVLALRADSRMPGRLWRVLGPLSCVLAGAFALRFCLVEAGMHPFLG